MQYAVASQRRTELYARVRSDLQPQAARDWYECSRFSQATTSKRRISTFKAAPKSKGRGGRKLGRAALNRRREEDWLKRSGSLSDYELYLVRRDCAPDPLLTPSAASEERRLWDELRNLHFSLRDTKLPAGSHSVNHAYFDALDARLMRTELAALEVAQERDLSFRKREKLLHVHRRNMAILHTEQELLIMSLAQSRAIGRDGAFIACGRRVKRREFGLTFGWWSGEQLLDKHGIEDPEDSDTKSDSSDDESDSTVSDSGGVSEAIIRDLFASDVDDDSDVDEYRVLT